MAASASRIFTTPTFIDIDDVRLNSGVVVSVRTISASGTYTITSTSGANAGNDNIISVNVSTSPVTIYLPTDVNALVHGRTYTIHSTVVDSGTITVNGNGRSINDAESVTISPFASLTFLYNATINKWFII